MAKYEDKTLTSEQLKNLGRENYQRLQFDDQQTNPDYGKINSDILTPTPKINYATYNEPSIYDISGLITPQMGLTQPEQKAQSYTDKLQEYNNRLLGESSYRTAQEEVQGIPGLEKTQQDLQSQLSNLVRENQAIPLLMQQRAEGRGITAEGLRPIETARLRENAIQALTTSSLLEASRGNLVTAQNLVDRAVAQKYDPIKEEINVLTKNLDLVLKSPAFSVADKNRAQAQLDIQNQRSKDIAEQEANEKAILNVANEAAKFGVDAVTLDKIKNAKTQLEATQIAQQAGMYEVPEEEKQIKTQIIESAEGEKLLINSETGETIQSFGTTDSTGNIVEGLITKYPDAGISPTDDLATAQGKLPNSKIYQKDIRISGGSGNSLGGGVAGIVSPITQSIVDNPSLFDDLTPTNRGKVIAELQANGYDTTNLGVKSLSDTAIKEISQTQKALDDIADLRSIIEENQDLIGPITGLQRFNPYSKARKIQADVDRVRQTVGKALEGGVLRKEDEEKYKKILATLTDTPSTALYKIDSIISSLQRDIENYKSLQQSSGRSMDINASLKKKNLTEEEMPTQDELRVKYNY